MATQSSREAALERRKALADGGKKAAGRYNNNSGRVRSASDARPTRTNTPVATAADVLEVAASAPAPRAARSLSAPSAAPRSGNVRRVSNPSRDLVLARREALARGGKRASTSKDRTRTDLGVTTAAATRAAAAAATTAATEKPCKCQEKPARDGAATLSLSSRAGSGSSAGGASRATARKASAQHNPSRALVLARREALSKRGKSASSSSKSGAAAVARQINPDLNGRDLAQKVRELKSKNGAAGTSRSGGTRPSGPNRHGSKQAAAADAAWKVGVSETLSGQTVTGTQANRSVKTTGNEAATCRTITGTEYLGAEVFQTFCGNQPAAPVQPAKVRVTATSHGNRVTGNEVGRSEKVTGDEPGTCKSVTGTEYISANQSAAYCGTGTPSVRKVGRSQTLGGQPVSGVLVGRSEKVTGDEPGSGRQLTGDQYLGAEAAAPGRAPTKVSSFTTLRGTGVTGTAVGRSQQVTGDEPGTCKVVTGTPYAGLEQSGDFCNAKAVRATRERTPVRGSNRMTGIQPGIGGSLTGADKGACDDVTGTPYIGADQQAAFCGTATSRDADFPQALTAAAWQQFSVQSPARAAQVQRETTGTVTGSTYEQGGRITGPFDMATGKVTGTEQFRFDHRASQRLAAAQAAAAPVAEQPVASRVTGEGSGTKVTGDDWDRGDRVTGTEGSSARRRNPPRVGPMSAMPGAQNKRNVDVPPPNSKLTGSSGSTDQGSLITVSGGARG